MEDRHLFERLHEVRRSHLKSRNIDRALRPVLWGGRRQVQSPWRPKCAVPPGGRI